MDTPFIHILSQIFISGYYFVVFLFFSTLNKDILLSTYVISVPIPIQIHQSAVNFPLKFILSQLTILYSKCCKFLVRHIPEIRLNNTGNTVMRNQQVHRSITFCFFLNIIQQIIDSLGKLQHGLSPIITVDKLCLGNGKFRTISRCGLIPSKILLF